jgi:hypothetical protein
VPSSRRPQTIAAARVFFGADERGRRRRDRTKRRHQLPDGRRRCAPDGRRDQRLGSGDADALTVDLDRLDGHQTEATKPLRGEHGAGAGEAIAR